MISKPVSLRGPECRVSGIHPCTRSESSSSITLSDRSMWEILFQKDVSEVVDDLAERDQYAFVSSGLHFSSSSIGAIGLMHVLMYLLLKQCSDLPCHFPGYFCIWSNRSHRFDYFATFIHYLCVFMPPAVGPFLFKRWTWWSLCATILVHAVHSKVRQILTSRHENWLGRTEKRSFTLSSPGVEPWPLDIQSSALANQPRTSVRADFGSSCGSLQKFWFTYDTVLWLCLPQQFIETFKSLSAHNAESLCRSM